MPATTSTVAIRYMIDEVADAVAFYTHLGFPGLHARAGPMTRECGNQGTGVVAGAAMWACR